MRLIDADALMETFETKAVLAWVKNIVNNAPTIDAVPVARCRECKWWKNNDCKNDTHGYVPFDENDFCSQGKRKDKT